MYPRTVSKICAYVVLTLIGSLLAFYWGIILSYKKNKQSYNDQGN